MTEPVATVVVPAFNRLDLVSRVLDGFAGQRTTIPWEVIVVDDGSEPPAADVIAGRDRRFRLIRRQPNRGRASAINAGLAAARGQILIICDSDIVPAPLFIDEHVAFHAQNKAAEDTHLGALSWGLSPPPFATFLGPRANPRMVGLEGEVPWTLWYTDNWSFKRLLVDAGIIHFDETFRVWGWEDIELAHRLAASGVRNVSTSAARGLHLQYPTLDHMLMKFAGSVPNLIHLASRVGHDDTVTQWLAHRYTSLPLVEAGESILRRSITLVAPVAERHLGIDNTLFRVLSTGLSDAVFRCGMQRGFVESEGASDALPACDVAKFAMLPHADLVRITVAVLINSGQTEAARMLLAFSSQRVAEASGDKDLATQFIGRATAFRSPPAAHPRRA